MGQNPPRTTPCAHESNTADTCPILYSGNIFSWNKKYRPQIDGIIK